MIRYHIDNKDITIGIESKILNASEKCFDNNNRQSYHVLITFVRRILQLSIKHESINHYMQYIMFPAVMYNLCHTKFRDNESLKTLNKICTESVSVHLRELIYPGTSVYSQKDLDIETLKELNIFFYHGFNGFSRLLYYMSKNSDVTGFKYALSQYQYLFNSLPFDTYNLRLRLRFLQNDLEKSTLEEINSLKNDYKIAGQYNTYWRHGLFGIKSWVYFLYEMDRITEITCINLIEQLKVQRLDPNDELSDLLFFRTNTDRTYFEWSEWDYIERSDGKVYTPPSPIDWLTTGFFIENIRDNNLYVNIDDYSNEDLYAFSHLPDSLTTIAKKFSDNFNHWKRILKVETIEELNDKTENLISTFRRLKRKFEGNNEEKIVNTPLSQSKIEEFKEKVGESWKKQARIRELFKLYDSRLEITDDKIKLLRVGRKIFFEKGKVMFIESDLYEHIYGTDSMGADIGHGEDDAFFDTIFSSQHNYMSGFGLIGTIDRVIKEIERKGVKPTAIIIPSERNYYDLLGSEDFIPKKTVGEQKNELHFFDIGDYRSIPVFGSFSNLLKNRIIVCDLNHSFLMRYKSNSDWYDEELEVSVNEVTDDLADEKFNESKERWLKYWDGMTITESEAKTLIKTSVFLNIWTIIDFQIKDKEKFIVGHIRSDPLEDD